jgi:hypothetical protein
MTSAPWHLAFKYAATPSHPAVQFHQGKRKDSISLLGKRRHRVAVRDWSTHPSRDTCRGVGKCGGSFTRDGRTRTLAWHGASRRTFEYLGERVARRDFGIDIRTQKGATFDPQVQETRRRKGNLRADEVKHLHLTLPFVVISRSSSEESHKVRSVQENNVGKPRKEAARQVAALPATRNHLFHAALQARADPSLVCARSTEPQTGMSDCLLSISMAVSPSFTPKSFH